MDRNGDGNEDDDANEADLVIPAGGDPDVKAKRAFDRIRDAQRTATLNLLLEVGEAIVVECYDGSLEAWHSRGKREASFRKLAALLQAEKESGMSASVLYRAVGIYEAEQVHRVSTRKHLLPSHVRAVLGLPVEVQADLLNQAEANGWSTDAITEEASKYRRQIGDGRGRPPLPGFVKTLNAMNKLLQKEDAFADLEAIPELDEDDAARRLETVLALGKKCDELAKALAPHVKRRTR